MDENDIAAIKARWAPAIAACRIVETGEVGTPEWSEACRAYCIPGEEGNAVDDIATLLAALEARDAELARLRRVEAAVCDFAETTEHGSGHSGRPLYADWRRVRAALDGSGSDVG
jgi:hypothetical protein